MHCFFKVRSILLVPLFLQAATAASFSSSSTAPVVDGADIANYGSPSGTDKWWTGSAYDYGNPGMTVGQTFTTGSRAVLLNAVTFRVRDGTEPSKDYILRIGEVAGDDFSVITAETATQTVATNADDYWTWTLDTPVLLLADTHYGVDVGLVSSTTEYTTGIPYIYYGSSSGYIDGSRFRSGTEGAGIGDSKLYQVQYDRIFHLDLEEPQSETFEFLVGDPADDSTDALIPPNLAAVFSESIVLGTGNLTVRNLSDEVETTVPVTSARVNVSENTLMIESDGLIDWNKSYAVWIDAGAIRSESGVDYTGITDDTTWNFTTAVGDPFLLAVAALKDHIQGTTILSGPEIAAHKLTIDAAKPRFDESAETIAAVFDLVSTYDTLVGPIFVAGSPAQAFYRWNNDPASIQSVNNQNIHWVVYTMMQYIMDEVYHADTIAQHEALLDGFKFGSSAHFPGAVDPPVDPNLSHTATISGSFEDTFGRNTQQWTLPARKPTGTYLAPGSIATVTVPQSLVGQGYRVRIGAHSWDLSGRPPVQRLERATVLYELDQSTIQVASPYGGGIYIEVPMFADAGVVDVTITGAVRSPYFSLKSFHTTTNEEWIQTERNHTAPWADFQTEKFMMQVPTGWVNAMDDPTTLMENWDHAMDAMNDLMGFPRIRGKETLYPQVDVILRYSAHAPGYPSVNTTYNPDAATNGYQGGHLVFGPQTGWNTEYHEAGHAYRFPRIDRTNETNVNLLHVAVWHRKFDYSLDDAFRGSVNYGNFQNVTDAPLDNTAVLWMTSFNFAPRDTEMADWEKAYQPQGHAKFVDIVRLFGWEGLDQFWYSMMYDQETGGDFPYSLDEKLLRLCQSVGEDIRPLLHFWGIHPDNPAWLESAVAAEGLHASSEIYNLLQRYKTLVPADNAAYQSWCLYWYGRAPSIGGYGVEREHARQWDTTDYFTANGWTQERPNGEIYTANSAADISSRVQEISDLYFGDYTVWASGYSEVADVDDPDQDSDGDGLSNREEWIWGLNPTDASSQKIFVNPFNSSGAFSYTRRAESLTGVQLQIWVSYDLVNWTHDTGATQTVSSQNANGSQTIDVQVSPSFLEAPSLYLQIRIVE